MLTFWKPVGIIYILQYFLFCFMKYHFQNLFIINWNKDTENHPKQCKLVNCYKENTLQEHPGGEIELCQPPRPPFMGPLPVPTPAFPSKITMTLTCSKHFLVFLSGFITQIYIQKLLYLWRLGSEKFFMSPVHEKCRMTLCKQLLSPLASYHAVWHTSVVVCSSVPSSNISDNNTNNS